MERIINVSFLSLLRFKSTKIPKPPDVQSPATSEPNVIVCLINNIESITDIAQFGINPTSETKNGCNGELIKQYFANTSSEPALDNIKPITIEIIKINTKILSVCFKG